MILLLLGIVIGVAGTWLACALGFLLLAFPVGGSGR